LELLKIGTRRSTLALWQANEVRRILRVNGIPSELVHLSSSGDRSLGGNLSSTVGQFVHGIDKMLIEGKVDITVHSAKDIPVDETPEVRTIAYLERGETSDLILTGESSNWSSLPRVLQTKVSNPLVEILNNLPEKSKVGTVSGRRQSFLIGSRPDLVPISVRGHIETRLDRLVENRVDYLILAEAGIRRLFDSGSLSERHLRLRTVRIREDDWPTAPGQGAIAINCRSMDVEKRNNLREILNHVITENAVKQERLALKRIGGGCLYPAGIKSQEGVITAAISPEYWRTSYCTGDLYEVYRYQGDVGDLDLSEIGVSGKKSIPLDEGVKLVTTLTSRRLSTQLINSGVQTVDVPVVELSSLPREWPSDFIGPYTEKSRWPILVLTSPFAAKCALEVADTNPDIARIEWLAIGEGTHKACFEAGVTVSYCGMSRDSEQLVEYISQNISNESELYIPRSSKSDKVFTDSLVSQGFRVRSWTGYENVPMTIEDIAIGQEDVLLISSSSSAKSWANNNLKIPKNILSMGKKTTETIETTPYFKGAEIHTLDGPTLDSILGFWESRVRSG
tara:strand:+ start:59058 stop:60752 length:1695 start_codon:yes stop_codon:yes gene_type:complete